MSQAPIEDPKAHEVIAPIDEEHEQAKDPEAEEQEEQEPPKEVIKKLNIAGIEGQEAKPLDEAELGNAKSFEEETQVFWTHNLRIMAAIVVTIVSAIFLWWFLT